jgi:hypothetical protein
MGYYLRVLSTSSLSVPLDALRGALHRDKLTATLDPEEEDAGGGWTSLLLAEGDHEFASIERTRVAPGELGESELDELSEEAGEGAPAVNGAWVVGFLQRVKTIYALQVLSDADADSGAGWESIRCVQNALWSFDEAILQADGEGFSNTDGYHVLWQFSDSAKGTWRMALVDDAGDWTRFVMELGDRGQRAAFLAGRLPEGVEIIE